MARYINPIPQLLDGNGNPIKGAKKFFFELGTTVKKTVYSDSALSVATDNPQLSDSNGRYINDIYIDGLYTEEQQDNSGTLTGYDGVQIWSTPLGSGADGQLQLWDSAKTYSIPELVQGSDDQFYESITNGNQGNNPIASPANWSLISFIKAGVADGVTVIKDANGNEALTITATTTAVNGLELTNAATTNNPTLAAEGEANTGMILADSNGNEIIIAESAAAAVNEITVTNAITTEGPSIAATGTDTNIDFDVDGKGTGRLRTKSTPVYGLVVLDTPIQLVNDTSTTATTQTAVDITAHTTGVAVKAIVRVQGVADSSAGGFSAAEVLVGEGGETLATNTHRAIYIRAETSGLTGDADTVHVNLASGEIFDYSIIQTGTTPTARVVQIYLVGYYI